MANNMLVRDSERNTRYQTILKLVFYTTIKPTEQWIQLSPCGRRSIWKGNAHTQMFRITSINNDMSSPGQEAYVNILNCEESPTVTSSPK